jgi:Helix-turn-helix family
VGPTAARALWQLLEPYHATVYFAPEARERYTSAGLRGGWMGYFASRSAPMGPVPAEVVTATFFVFHPAMVARAIPDAWRLSSPERALAARRAVVDSALRRLLGEEVAGPAVVEAAELARRAVEGCQLAGRTLYGAHASLPWPEEPHLALWHAATLLREHRFDGHVTALAAEEVDGCMANLTLSATANVTEELTRTYRGWSEDEWAAAADRLRRRGWLDAEGRSTQAGDEARRRLEEHTDRLALGPLQALGEPGCERLAALLSGLVHRIVDGGGFRHPNPMGIRPAEARVS